MQGDKFDEEDEFADMMSDLPTEFDNNTFPDCSTATEQSERAFKYFFSQQFDNTLIPDHDENL